jgi:hypothetical protein
MARHAFRILVRRQLGRGCGEFKINGFGRADKRAARDSGPRATPKFSTNHQFIGYKAAMKPSRSDAAR